MTRLRQWLLDDLSLKEARISNRSADDVRIFTYATVVFLPLSFVSSIFSMAGAPDRATVEPFIIAAVVALVATIVFLLNAGSPMRNITYYKNELLRLPQDDSILEHADSQWKAVLKTLHLWLIKSPARRVLTSRDVLAQWEKQYRQRKKNKTSILVETSRNQQLRIQLKEKLKRRRETTQVVVGLALLPLFLLSILFRFIGQNVFDLAEFILITLPHYQGRRIKQQISKIDDDRESIRSHIKLSANQMKNTKNDETIMEQQELREDEQKTLKQFHHSNLERFIQTPRFGDLGQYLHEGKTWNEARKEMKQKRKKANAEFEVTRKSYKHVRKTIMKRAAKAEANIAEIDLGTDLSSDDSSENEKNPGNDGRADRFGFSMPRIFRRRRGKSKEQDIP